MRSMRKTLVAAALVALLAPSLALAAIPRQMAATQATHKAKAQQHRAAVKVQGDQRKALLKERAQLRKQMNSSKDPALRASFQENRAKIKALSKVKKGGN